MLLFLYSFLCTHFCDVFQVIIVVKVSFALNRDCERLNFFLRAKNNTFALKIASRMSSFPRLTYC